MRKVSSVRQQLIYHTRNRKKNYVLYKRNTFIIKLDERTAVIFFGRGLYKVNRPSLK